jgi:uncharacterized RDD family membrane protein YckC
MDTATSHFDTTDNLPRAGFWRRWLATAIDSIIAIFPFQILAAILFAMTAGMVQMDSGFVTFCADTQTIPQSLDPPPPHDSNFARVCRVSFFGATTGAVLTVGRITQAGSTTTAVTQGYMLDTDGNPIHGTSIDWIVWLAFLAYLVGMISKTGRTWGARIVGVRVIDAAAPSVSEVPIRKAIIRYLAMTIGFVPVFAILIYQYANSGSSADAMFTSEFFRWGMSGLALAALWVIVLIVQVAMKRDPVYDRLAGTAVVRDRRTEPTSTP